MELLSLVYLLCHGLAILLFPDHARPLSFAFLIAAPLLAGGICVRRAWTGARWDGWAELAAAMLLWAAGMTLSLYYAVIVASPDGVPGLGVLLYVLYGVPLIFAVASPAHEAWHVRLVDAVLALVLGSLFFVHTFAFATISSASEQGVLNLRLMFDIENLFIALFALVRYRASLDPARRAYFRTLTIFACVYCAAAAYINHAQMTTDYGTLVDLVIDVPFLVLAAVAWRGMRRPAGAPGTSRRLALLVRAGSPLMLPATLLMVSGLIVRSHTVLAVTGFVAATLGYGLRNVLVQLRGFAERERLDALARIDALTGLPNRRQFDEALRREWGRAQRSGTGLAVLMIDIDHFKLLNDGFGHPVGDQRLQEVARALAGCATRSADLIARYGGEEFVAVLPSTGSADAAMLAEAMRRAVARLNLASPAAGGIVTVSIGVGHVDPVQADDPAMLMAVADAALYEAKQSGRNRVVQRQVAVPETPAAIV